MGPFSPKSNVLIDSRGRPRLCDFGLVDLVAEFQGISYIESSISSAVRWTAPEIYQIPEDHSVPKADTKSDIYSFACVMLQVEPINALYERA
jgi:serine/threonine protein kinase